jgi:hypothetical protein
VEGQAEPQQVQDGGRPRRMARAAHGEPGGTDEVQNQVAPSADRLRGADDEGVGDQHGGRAGPADHVDDDHRTFSRVRRALCCCGLLTPSGCRSVDCR